jgi:hypothetical protein
MFFAPGGIYFALGGVYQDLSDEYSMVVVALYHNSQISQIFLIDPWTPDM